MDSLTQIVLGAAVGEAFLGRKIGNRALLYGAIIGTIPDLDIFFGKLYDPITALEIHRGFSHSILFFILFSPILGIAIKKIESKSDMQLSQTTLAAFFCLLTHALLDSFTTWGTQLFWPSSYRAGIQSISVIDPLYTVPFLVCVILAMRLPKESLKRRKWNRIGLLVSSLYLLLTVVVQKISMIKFEKSLAENYIEYDRIIVKPALFNIILWNANIETPNGYWVGDYSYFDTKPITYAFYPKGTNLIAGIENRPIIQQLIRISEGWYTISKRDEKLYFNDLRFGLLNESDFVFSYEISTSGNKIVANEVNNKDRREGVKLLKNLLTRIRGN